MSSQKNELVEAWGQEWVPILEGVLFPDGRWVKLSLDGQSLVWGPETKWAAEDLSDNLTAFTQLCKVDISDESAVVAGEGGFGGDGIIALIDSASAKLTWVLFCESSNPFESLRWDGTVVQAKSTNEDVWQINPRKPERSVITRRIRKSH